MSEDEFDQLLRAVSGSNQHDTRARLILSLMYYAGLRRREVVNLTLDRIIDGDAPRIEIRGSKFGKGRNVPLDPRLVPAVKRWTDRRAHCSPWLVSTYQRTVPNAVAKTPQPPGSQVKVNTVWNTVKTAARRAGLRSSIRPHMFRHACATNWLRSGLSVREVQYLLGHSNLQTTQRYLHVHEPEIAAKVYALGTPTHNSGLKDCDWCAEPIRIAARICRYCQRNVA